MSVKDLQARVEIAVVEEERTRRLAKHLEQYLTLDPLIVQAVIKFLVRYIRTSPNLLVRATNAARKEGILTEFAPILKEAASYWNRERNIISAPGRLISLADEAYLTSAFVHFVSASYKGATGVELLSHDLHHSNLAMRQLIGQNNIGRLDDLVDQTMHRRPVQTAIRNLQRWGGTLDLGPETAPFKGAQQLLRVTENAPSYLSELSVVSPSLAEHKVKGGISYRVWYATNRAPVVPGDLSQGFTNEPDSEDRVHYGICNVFVPHSHKHGSLGTIWIKRWITLRFKDDHLKLTSQESFADAQTFFTNLNIQIAAQPKDLRHLLVYIHGFDVSFEGAALRAAQIGADLNVAAETVFFSWPSHADKDKYVPDQGRIDNSESVLREFLTDIVKNTKAEAVHIVAHSMGNRGLIRIASQLHSSGVKFANIILAAPDVDQKFFRKHAVAYPLIANRTTLYASRRDLALKAASCRFLGDGPRAGLTPPITIVPAIDTVEVTQFNLFDFGHGYWAQAREVVGDIYQLMRYGAAPPRIFLKEKITDRAHYWILQ